MSRPITRGINIRSSVAEPYAQLILDRVKTCETRETDSLRPYVGKYVGIVQTGMGPARLIGTAFVAKGIECDYAKFRSLWEYHRVPAGSRYDCKPGGTKWLYPLWDVKYVTARTVTTRGIVARDISEFGLEVDSEY